MRIHYFQHVPFEGLGIIRQWAADSGCSISSTQLYDNPSFPNPDEFDLLIIMGGPMSVHDTRLFPWLKSEKEFIRKAIKNEKRILGICLGAQLIADVLGAKVYPGVEKEIGWFPIETMENANDSISQIFPNKVDVFHWHGETFDIPDGAIRIAKSAICQNQGFVFNDRIIGFQFHLESTPESVEKLIENCSHEIVDAPYIQSAQMMLETPYKFQIINEIMGKVLVYFDQQS